MRVTTLQGGNKEESQNQRVLEISALTQHSLLKLINYGLSLLFFENMFAEHLPLIGNQGVHIPSLPTIFFIFIRADQNSRKSWMNVREIFIDLWREALEVLTST